jgi:hypothetical protein
MHKAPVPCPDCKRSGPTPGCFLCDGTGYWETETEDPNGTLIVPSYHPSFLRRGAMNLKTVLSFDLQRAVHIAKHGFTRLPVDYQTKPSIDDAIIFRNKVRDNPRQLLTYDIETPNSAEMPEDEREEDASYELRSIQFSLTPQTGIFFPNDPAYMDIAREIMRYTNPKAGHNAWNFDDPRLRHNNFEIAGDENDDTLWMWHHAQPDLPAHLQFVGSFFGMDFPWKHLSGSDAEFYGCADVDVVQRIMAKLPADLKARGIWQNAQGYGGYANHIRKLQPILVETSKRGIPIDDVARIEMKTTLEIVRDGVHDDIQKLIPESVFKLDPKKGYAGTPPRVKELLNAGKSIEEISRTRFEDPQGNGFYFVIRDRPKTVEAVVINPDIVPDDKGGMVPVKVHEVVEESCWFRKYEFNPAGSQQVLRYMKAKKHPIPKDHKKTDMAGNAKETTGKDELERLGKKTDDPFYSMVIDYREHDKMIGTYVVGWAPAKDGCVHTQFTFRPAQGQLSSINPNVQNAPKHQQDKPGRPSLAKAFRKMIKAHPGKKLVELDLKAAHALTAGFEFRDPVYMRMARMDIHSYFGCHVLRLPEKDKLVDMPDDELREFLKYIKKKYQHERDFKWKHALLGYGNGMGPNLLYQQYREDFSSLKECKMLMDLLDHVFPVSAAGRKAVREKAHREGFLLSRYGFIRWFTDVFHWDSKRSQLVPGDQYNQAVVFLFANDAHCHLKDVKLNLDAKGMLARYGFINCVHDSLMFHVDDHLVEECIAYGCAEMTKPNLVLVDPVSAPGGLEFGVSASVGDNWADMEEVKIPVVSSTMSAVN